MDTLDWLLDSDPAIGWQARRDLTDGAPATIVAERARVPSGALCTKILGQQGADGSWHRSNSPEWMLNVYTMQLLRATGVDPGDPKVQAAVARLATGFHWHDQLGGKPFFEGETEPCLNGGTLAVGAYFGRASTPLAQRLLEEQLPDGGWNCEAPKSQRSSYHTTICVLEGLLEYERATGSPTRVAAARHRAEEYLLSRVLFRRLSTGEVAHPSFLKFSYPPRYCYDVLRALDYFRASGAPPDERMGEAMRAIESRRQPDGRWLLDDSREEALPFALGETVGEPSRWNTLRALRVLRWYERKKSTVAGAP